MTLPTSEVLRTNLVLVGIRLLAAPEEFEAFRLAVGVDVQVAGAGLSTNIQSGITEPIVGLALNRDRIALELSADRTVISRDYPQRDELHRLAEIAGHAIGISDISKQHIRAYGFNIEMVLNQNSGAPAFSYLSRRLFDAEPLGNEGWQFVGGAGRLIFNDGGRRWTIKLEPRFNSETESRIFLDANLHVGKQSLPDESEIMATLEEIWDKIHVFTRRLDETGGRNG